jgi:hypothetical protein
MVFFMLLFDSDVLFSSAKKNPRQENLNYCIILNALRVGQHSLKIMNYRGNCHMAPFS